MHATNPRFDFRDHAAAESLRLVELHGERALDEFSVCLPNDDPDRAAIRRFGYAVIARFVLGGLGLAAAGLLAAIDRTQSAGDEVTGLLAVALACGAGGILLLIGQPWFQRRFVRRRLGPRFDDLQSIAPDTRPECVGVENTATFHKFKAVAEDLGWVLMDAARRRVVIEGIGYRYVIHGRDARQVQEVHGGPTTATAIRYAVGNTELSIALQCDAVWYELKRTFGAGDPLVKRLRETLYGQPQDVLFEP